MNSRFSIMKRIAVSVVLAAGFAVIARADDSSTNPFTGESYAALNGGNVGHVAAPPFFKMPSSWRQANPSGLSERELEALSSEALGNAFQRADFDKAPSSFAQGHPRALSVRELQALSSWGPAWH